MRNFWTTLVLLAIAATLTACGGDSNAFGTPGSSTTTSAAVAKLTVSPSVTTLPPDGTTATITVMATDANNVAVSGAVVSFATNTGTIAVTSGTTSATGQATATLAALNVAAGTVITVTATSGGVTGKTTVTVANSQQTLTLTTSIPQIPSTPASSPATIKALLVDANNNVVSGATVNFQATSGALTVTQGTTDATGTAIATLSAGTSAQNRVITVTATSGTSTATIQVSVVGSTLTLSGPTSLVQGTPGTFTVTLDDSGGNPIVGQSIALSSASNNTLSAATVTTGTQGTATFTVSGTTSGSDTITATAYSGSLVSSQQITVSNQAFAISAPANNTQVAVGSGNAVPVTVTWSASGAGQTGTVNFSTSRGTVSPTSVAVNGGVMAQSVTLYSTTAGPATLSAIAVQGGATVASAQTSVMFYAPVSTSASVSVQANPSRVATQGQSTVVATVEDASGNPVENATVAFTLTDSTGGSLSSGTAVTNTSGQATITYTAGGTSSANNGVTIAVQVQGVSNITNDTQLTVGGQTVFLSLGTGNTILEYPAGCSDGSTGGTPCTQYELPYSVQAADSSGAGLSGVTITFSVTSIAYYLGDLVYGSTWGPHYSNSANPPVACAPVYVYENNGVIVDPVTQPVPSSYVHTLIPGSVATTDVSSAVTSSGGSATVNLIYPKDHALWVQVALTATATVSGTQNSTTAQFILPGAANDYATQTDSPPGPISPYGEATSCYAPE